MAQGRPLSRHGRYDAFIGMQVKEAAGDDFYGKSDYMSNYASSRPKSGYRNRGQNSSYEYDQYARVTTPREEPPARPVSRRGADRYGSTSSRRMSVDSEESFASSPPAAPLASPDSVHSRSLGHQRPPSSASGRPPSSASGRPPSSASGRPPSGRPKSASHRGRAARKPIVDADEVNLPYIPDNDMPDLTSARPPSSFSKYRPLPSIGTPTPPDFGEDGDDDIKLRTHHPNHLYNVVSEPGPHKQRPYQHSQQPHANSHRGHHPQQPVRPPLSSSGKRGGGGGRVSSAVSDISVISTRANSRSNPPQAEPAHAAELIERLDLSKLEKEAEEASAAGRRRRPSASSSVSPTKSTKPSSGSHLNKASIDPGDLYDGDDDDSDTSSIPRYSSGATSVPTQDNAKVANAPPKLASPPQSRRTVKKTVVVIPSPDEPPVNEILLAVKLPTDGTRHQRYFRTNEKLHAVVEFAEEVAGQDFGGYILVASAPKNVYRDLDDTIELAGLEDKTVLHLEENDLI
ncbi:UBX domain-containing protein 10-like [Elysia marginata]|uniref:UBX domain-containing protein 10-like n=1 Tax=Elysia marginata TaxID=1093978 RepID=A0AAV4EGG6_9GAST|nr:UBX domain-containing protein 10-like [Elysia marginata]